MVGWDWKEHPWLSYKDWSLRTLLNGLNPEDNFTCPQAVPPALGMYPDSETPERRVPALVDLYKTLSGLFAWATVTQGPDATGATPTENPVYMAGLDTNATPKVVPIRVTDTTGVVHVLLTAGTAEIGKLGAGTAEIGKLGAGTAIIGKLKPNWTQVSEYLTHTKSGAGDYSMNFTAPAAGKTHTIDSMTAYCQTGALVVNVYVKNSGATNIYRGPTQTMTAGSFTELLAAPLELATGDYIVVFFSSVGDGVIVEGAINGREYTT